MRDVLQLSPQVLGVGAQSSGLGLDFSIGSPHILVEGYGG